MWKFFIILILKPSNLMGLKEIFNWEIFQKSKDRKA